MYDAGLKRDQGYFAAMATELAIPYSTNITLVVFIS